MCGEDNKCCGKGCGDCPCQNGQECLKNKNSCCMDSEDCFEDNSSSLCNMNDFDDYDDYAKDTVMIGDMVDDFELDAYHENQIKKVRLSDHLGKWIVLFFYPADFTFVCPTELEDLADNYEKIKAIGGEVMSVSTDTVYVHKAWSDTSEAIKKVKFPMLADPSHELSKYYNVLIKEEGVTLRATFIIDPDGILRASEINDNSVGRNAKELLRKLEAMKFVRENGGNVCPAKWEPGDETLKPNLDLIGKI